MFSEFHLLLWHCNCLLGKGLYKHEQSVQSHKPGVVDLIMQDNANVSIKTFRTIADYRHVIIVQGLLYNYNINDNIFNAAVLH